MPVQVCCRDMSICGVIVSTSDSVSDSLTASLADISGCATDSAAAVAPLGAAGGTGTEPLLNVSAHLSRPKDKSLALTVGAGRAGRTWREATVAAAVCSAAASGLH